MKIVTKNRIFLLTHRLYKKKLIPLIAEKICSLMFSNKLMSFSSSKNYLNKFYPDNGGSSQGNNLIKEQYDLQIIIPAYNCESTIEACLHSVLNQKTDYSFVIDVIDDGSTDNTGNIIDIIAKKSNRHLNILHQSNKGFSGARNAGLKKLTGKYVMFVDADDTLPENAINSLLDQAFKYDGDIIEGGYNVFTNDGKITSTFRHLFNNDANPFCNLYGYPWGKLYKATLFRKVVFPENYWFEDTVAMYRIWPNAKKTVTISNIVYNYRNNPRGITSTFGGTPKSLDTLWITQKLLSECDNIDEQIYDFTLSQIIMNTLRLSYLSDNVNKANFIVSKHLIEQYFAGEYRTNKKELLEVEHTLKVGTYTDFLNCVYKK